MKRLLRGDRWDEGGRGGGQVQVSQGSVQRREKKRLIDIKKKDRAGDYVLRESYTKKITKK